jgi:catechol 2,3-dioxygenase-like lactoylglutathione lyase family enzyme
MIKKIGHTAYNVSDMDKSMHFYCDILGFKYLFQLKDENKKPWINYLKISEGQFIELFYNGVKTADIDTRSALGYNHLCLEVDDIKATLAEFKTKGLALDIEIMQGADLNYQAWAHDPDGNRIEFMQFHPDAPQLKN